MLQKPTFLLRLAALSTFVVVALFVADIEVGKTSKLESAPKASSSSVEKKISDPPQLKDKYGKQGPRFEVNQGQIDTRARYYVRTRGYNAYYTDTEVVLSLLQNGSESQSSVDYNVLRMKLIGANTNAAITGENQLEGVSNYYIGNDPKKWRTNVPAYQSVRYKEIYDGIDMVHHGTGTELEYDFVVQPGADPNRIQFEFKGVEGLRLDRDGSLVFKTLGGELRHSKPFVYQEVNGERREIKGNFTKRGNRIGFGLGNYDRSRALIIDPSLTYSTFLGGSGPDFATSIALDTNGNAYVTGYTGSLDFPQVNPARSRSADFECFITKLNTTGTALIFSTYFGGSSTDRAYSIAVDSVGSAYVTGQTSSSDYPRAGPIQLFLRGTSDAFVTKLTQAGLLQYSTYLGGGATELGQSIAVDNSGNMFVVGQTDSNDFPTQSASQGTNGSGFDGFVSAIGSGGASFTYSTYLGGNGVDSATSVAVDGSSNAYVAGATTSTNFPVSAGVVKGTNGGSSNDAFVTKFNPGGTRNYSTYFGGVNSFDKARAIAIDSSGNAYITGNTNTFSASSDFPIVSAVQPTFGGAFNDDAFVSKINSTATQILYSTFLGGSLLDYGNGIAVDTSFNAYIVGYTASSNFPTSNALMPAYNSNGDAFVTKVGPNGNTFGFSTFLGSVTADEATDVALCGATLTACASTSSVYITGTTNNLSNGVSDFPTTAGVFQASGPGSADAFITKINQTGVTPYIQGTVATATGTLLPNVGLSLTGAQSKTTLTGSNGQYVFQLLPSGTYLVTPGNYNYAFNPANRNLASISTAQTGQNFSAVTLLNDNLANAINLTGSLGTAYYGANIGATKECTEADHAGNPATASVWYRWTAPSTTQPVFVSTQGSSIDTTLDVYQGSSLNVCSLPTAIASNDDFGLDGTSRLSFVAQANTTYYIAIDTKFGTGPFTLTIDQGLTISGKVQNVNGRGLPGMLIRIDGDLVNTTTSNSSGNYSFTVPRGGSFTITPVDVSVSLWTPSNATVNNIQANATNVNFTATFPSPSITGELKNLTQGVVDVAVTVGGSGLSNRSCNVASNAGVVTYTCPNLNIHGDYLITPSSTTYAFNPASRNFNDIAGDIFQGPGSEFSGTPAPVVTTTAASSIGSTTATLNGTVNPRGVATQAAFVWSTSPTFITSTSTSFQNVGSGNTAVSYNAILNSLSPGTTYYFVAFAQNASQSTQGAVLNFTTAPQVTIQTSPAGRQISIDGGPSVAAPQTVSWTPGTTHTIATTATQAGTTGTQYIFANWSDGGAISHTVTAPSVNTTYTANFNTQYFLTMSAGSGGTVSPASGFFNSGQSVQITATPNSGFTFNSWTGTGSGAVNGGTSPANVTMNEPITETASFTQSSPVIALSAASYNVNESAGSLTVTVNRSGNTSAPASIDYRTSDTDTFTVGCADVVNNQGGAYGRCDYATSLDTLNFAAGETSKTFQIPIINDVIDENDETFTLTLANPTGATLGTPSSATVTILDNDTGTSPNPIFSTPFFVRQQYLDFLSREPDPPGFDAWVNVLNNCSDVNNNPTCDRIIVSKSFFESQEFQLKGYFVYRFYKLALNRLPTYPEIVTDMRGVTGTTPAEVFQKKAAFTNAFMLRPEFATLAAMTNHDYVVTLMGRYNLGQITTPDPANPDGTNKVTLTIGDLENRLNGVGGTLTRAQVLRAIADSDQVFNAEFNQAFVAMQYFGYLRRSPDTAGFNAWVAFLNANPTDFRTMVNGFMNSTEYKLRFGPGNP